MGAAFDSHERNPPRCLPGTRQAILEKIDVWVKAGVNGTSVLWLHGPAGAGKSAIARTVAGTCAARSQLAATFFFARTVAGRDTIKYVFPTITVQLALSAPERRERLQEILDKNPYIVQYSLGSIDLIASLCQDCSETPPTLSLPFLVVIDGLDECREHDDQCQILEQVYRIIHDHRLPLRFLIVSRPESHLCEAFEESSMASITETISVYGDFRARSDIFTYLRSEFSRIYESRRHRDVMEFVSRPWPSDEVIQQIVNKSGGYFIYASTIIRFTDEEYFEPPKRLDQILNSSNLSVISDSPPFAELDNLYMDILSFCPEPQIPLLKRILGYAVFPSSPRGIGHIAAFLRLPEGEVKLALRGLRSLVSFEGVRGPLEMMHASFTDFLLDEARSGVYYINPDEWYSRAFCDGFSLGVDSLGSSAEHGSQPPQCSEGAFLASF